MIAVLMQFLSWGVEYYMQAEQLCELRSGEREVMGSIPGRDIAKSLKMVLAASHLALRFTG